MRIGLLLSSVYASNIFGQNKIFAPKELAVQLCNGLVDRGHEVYLYSSRDIVTKAHLVSGNYHLTDEDLTFFQFRKRELMNVSATQEIIKTDFEMDLTLAAFTDAIKRKLDIIHSYLEFRAHYFEEVTQFPTVYTLHDPFPQRKDTLEYQRYLKFVHHRYVTISNAQRIDKLPLNYIDTVYHGLDLGGYQFRADPDNILIHFGRILPEKGTDTAIKVAQIAGIPLEIASSPNRGIRSEAFYKKTIERFIDNKTVKIVGFLGGKAKSDYIGRGKAFIFPLQWAEPFGMVLLESMACGTPVIAYNRGSVPEIVRDGVTGFIVEPEATGPAARQPQNQPTKGHPAFGASRLASPVASSIPWVIKKRGIEGLVEAVRRIGEIDRRACRKHVEENFTVEKMVLGYEKVYNTVVNRNVV